MSSKPAKITHRDSLRSCQAALTSLARRVRRLDLPAFGPLFSNLGGSDLADALIGYRVLKNLPEVRVAPDVRRTATIESMLDYDREGLTTFDRRKLPKGQWALFVKSQELLKGWLAGMPRSYKFRAPSGETVETSFGMVDLLLKLEDPDQWRVSLEASHEAAAVCYHNTQLKRLVKGRFRAKHGFLWRSVAKAWAMSVEPDKRSFHTFHRMFVDLCIIQNTSRLSTVPKNAEKDRPISMEPLWNMVAQLSFAYDLREQLYRKTGIDLPSLAALHRSLIRSDKKATVDFSSASNSNWMCVLESLWPQKVVRRLKALRTPICEWDGDYHYYNMLAPMGCGFTFEVMTLTLTALARSLDPHSTVFGDDVIIEADKAQEFMGYASSLGWVVNDKKSFVEGNFRESCGGFHDLSTHQDILSYDFHEITDLYQATTTANKLYQLLVKAQCGQALRKELLSCYCKMIIALPCDTFRAHDTVLETLPDGVVIVPSTLIKPWRTQNKVEALVSSYWHRPVSSGWKWSYTQNVVRPRLDDTADQVYLTAYIKRGSAYDVKSRDKVLSYEMCETASGTPLTRVPLLSFF